MVKNMFGDYWILDDMKLCVGPGWGKLIEDLYKICDENDIIVFQVKEKFGGLRFYVGDASEEVFDMIKLTEENSFKICEICGTTREVFLTGGGFIQSLCKKCREKEGVI